MSSWSNAGVRAGPRRRVLARIAVPAIAALAALVGLMACGGGDGDDGADVGDGVTKVRAGIAPFLTSLPFEVALEEGFFEENGIDMEFAAVTPTIDRFIPAMGRQIDVAVSTLPDVIKARQQGVDIVVVSGLAGDTSERKITAVFAGKETGIQTAEDLVGKTVGVVTLGGNIHPSTLGWLTNEGINPEGIDFVEVPAASMLDQLNAGQIDALETTEPVTSAVRAAGHDELVAPLVEVTDPATQLSVMAARDWAEQNPDTVAAIVKSLEDAMQFIEENEERAREILVKFSGLPPKAVESAQLPFYTTELSAGEVTAWAELLAEIGQLEGSPRDVDPDPLLAIPE